MNLHCSVTERKGAKRERGERWREGAEKGFIREGGFGRDFQAPPSVSASANQRPAAPGEAETAGEGTRLGVGGGSQGHPSLRLQPAATGN